MTCSPLLWLCGPSGVGKSAVAWAIYSGVSDAAYVDTDQLGMCYPARAEDPGNDRLMAANVAAMWPNFRRAGARCLIVSGCIDTPDLVPTYTAIPYTTATIVRLRADREILRHRFLARGRYVDLIEAALAEADALDNAGFPGLCMDTTGKSIADIAEQIRSTTHWPVR